MALHLLLLLLTFILFYFLFLLLFVYLFLTFCSSSSVSSRIYETILTLNAKQIHEIIYLAFLVVFMSFLKEKNRLLFFNTDNRKSIIRFPITSLFYICHVNQLIINDRPFQSNISLFPVLYSVRHSPTMSPNKKSPI